MTGFPTTKAQTSFLPEDYITRRSEARTNYITLALFVVVLFGVIGAFFVTNQRWEEVRVEQAKVNDDYKKEAAKIEQLKNLEKQRAQMIDKAEVTTALIERVPRSVLLAELVTRMPANITLETLELKSKRIDPPKPTADPKGKGAAKPKDLSAAKNKPGSDNTGKAAEVKAPRFEYTVEMTGLAAENTDVSDFLTGLKSCDLLENVDLAYIQTAIVSDQEFRKFAVGAKLREGADARLLQAQTAEKMSEVQAQAQAAKATTPAAASPPAGPSQGGQP